MPYLKTNLKINKYIDDSNAMQIWRSSPLWKQWLWKQSPLSKKMHKKCLDGRGIVKKIVDGETKVKRTKISSRIAMLD